MDNDNKNTQPEDVLDIDLDSMSEEQVKEQSEAVKKSIAKPAKDTTESKKMYSEDEVRRLFAQLMEEQKKNNDDMLDDEPEAKTCRLPRYQNKYIVAFKNMQTDEFLKEQPDKAVYAIDVFDEKSRQNIPWVTLVFEDGSELMVPLNSIIKQSHKIVCEIVEIHKEKDFKDFGKVEVQDVKPGQYSKEGTGVFVKAEAKQYIYRYDLKLPNGTIIKNVQPEVLNW